MKTVLVTGATGFIGTALCNKLFKEGIKVYAVGRNQVMLEKLGKNKNCIPIQLDFSQYNRLPSFLNKKEQIDVFFHLAWLAGGLKSDDIYLQLNNVVDSIKTFEIAKEINAKKYLMAGSYYQFKMAPLQNCKQQIKYDSIFGIAKSCATEMIRNIADKYSIQYVNAFIPKVFGPGDNSTSAPVIIIKKLLLNESIKLINGLNKDDWVFINDIIDGLIACVSNCGTGNNYYIGNREWKQFRQIITDMKTALCSESELLFGEYPDNSYIDYKCLNLNALYNDTGFECKSNFFEAVLLTSDYIKISNKNI